MTCECGETISKRARQCKPCSNRKRICTLETRVKMRNSKLCSENPNWKDVPGYNALHMWVRARKVKPECCEECKDKPPYDLANISGLYRRSIDDFEYLCRHCHMAKDGRFKNLRQFGAMYG